MYQNSPNLFSFKINYDQVENPVSNNASLHNGNISETYWRTASSNIKRSYGYEYDNLNRLTNAIYLKSDAQTDAYNEAFTYDANGNILTLARNGNYDVAPTTIEIDKLDYTYDSYNVNRLIKVTDLTNSPLGFSDGANNAIEYDYDGHGNMIRDDNKGITSILYNHLNLPTQITFSGTTTRKIQYLYNAVGAKQKKVVTDGTVITTTDYLSGFQYQNNVLEFFPHAEGYVKYTEGYFNYVFNYTDHLGNVRLSYAKDPNGGATRIMEENHYYPFGLKHTNYDNNVQRFAGGREDDFDYPVIIIPDIFGSGSYKYKFGGNEFQDELELNVYDYDNRVYDQAIGRFWQMDPLAENGRRWSPYNYAFNNPVYWADPDGMWPILPSWNDVKKTYNQSKATVSKTFNETQSSVTKTYNDTKKSVVATTNKVVASTKGTLKEGQQWVKDNKQQLLSAAKGIQDVGDNTTTAGLVTAAAGAPVAGVGAAPGLAVATAGGVVSGIGVGLEIATNFIAGDASEGIGVTAVNIAGELAGKAVDKAIPGPNPDVTPQVKELLQVGQEFMQNKANDKAKEVGNALRQ